MALDEVSKSARKREAARLQSVGRSLTELNPAQLADVPLSDDLAKAITDYHRFSSNEAKRRQLQLIGKLMRKADASAIEVALADIEGRSARARFEFRQLEAWRERLIDDPGALTDYLAAHPETDRQQLRHHISRVHKAHDPVQRRAAARALFRFLRGTASDSAQPD